MVFDFDILTNENWPGNRDWKRPVLKFNTNEIKSKKRGQNFRDFGLAKKQPECLRGRVYEAD